MNEVGIHCLLSVYLLVFAFILSTPVSGYPSDADPGTAESASIDPDNVDDGQAPFLADPHNHEQFPDTDTADNIHRINDILAQVELLRDWLKSDADFDIAHDCDRIVVLAPVLACPPPVNGSYVKEWFAIAVQLSMRPVQQVMHLSVIMVQYGMQVMLDGGSESDLGLALHQLLQFGLQLDIETEILELLDVLTPGAISVRNEHDETPLLVAFRHIPDNNTILTKLIEISTDPDLIYALRTVLSQAQIHERRWARIFDDIIHRILDAHDYDLDAFFDEIGIGDDKQLCKTAESAIRIQDTFFRHNFLMPFIHIFWPVIKFHNREGHIVPDDQVPDLLCDQFGLIGGHRTFYIKSLSWIKSEEISVDDLLRHCDYAVEIQLDHIVQESIRMMQLVSNEVTKLEAAEQTLAGFLELLFRLADLPIDEILSQDSAATTARFLLLRLDPNSGIRDSEIHNQIARVALIPGPGHLQTNLLRLSLYLGRDLEQDTSLLTEWLEIFTREYIVAFQAIWPDLIFTLQTLLATTFKGTAFPNAVLRVVLALFQHPDMVDELLVYQLYPSTSTSRLIRDFLKKPYASVLARMYQLTRNGESVSDGDVAAMPHPDPSEGTGIFSNWVRMMAFTPATDEQCLSAEDDCTICLTPHQPSSSITSGHDYTIQVPCGHLFHDSCVMKWLQWTSVCPLCRASIYEFNQIVSLVYLQWLP